jgi:hypothetical protein
MPRPQSRPRRRGRDRKPSFEFAGHLSVLRRALNRSDLTGNTSEEMAMALSLKSLGVTRPSQRIGLLLLGAAALYFFAAFAVYAIANKRSVIHYVADTMYVTDRVETKAREKLDYIRQKEPHKNFEVIKGKYPTIETRLNAYCGDTFFLRTSANYCDDMAYGVVDKSCMENNLYTIFAQTGIMPDVWSTTRGCEGVFFEFAAKRHKYRLTFDLSAFGSSGSAILAAFALLGLLLLMGVWPLICRMVGWVKTG